MTEQKPLTELYNAEAVVMFKPIRYVMQPYVTFGKSQNMLRFNDVVAERLGIRDWTHCVIGYQPEQKIVVLKKCDAEEEGARSLRIPQTYFKDKKTGETNKYEQKNARFVIVGKLLEHIDIAESTKFNAEKINDNIIVLQEAK